MTFPMTEIRAAVWSGVLASVFLTTGALAQQRLPAQAKLVQNRPAQARPAQQSPRDPVRLTGLPNGVVVFSQGRTTGRADLSGQLHGCTAATYDPTASGFQESQRVGRRPGAALNAHVVDLVRSRGQWYFTFQVGLSPNCNVQGQCGAGTNIDLVWVKLSPSLKVLGKQVEVVEDCRSDTNAQDYTGVQDTRQASYDQPLLGLRGGVLKVTRATPAPDNQVGSYRVQTLSYSRAAPQRGIQVGAVKVVTKQ
ncbi:hypothetical protein [Deinococcus sp.]|uniref:hypothetical protein n=1 Tax=Deinococcus sp. TaxID=47478 RepID=UPI0025EE3487|nr:hypothetical protein [Deinococcus sp.]